ncbi:MAG: DUF1800 domain-containing protein [Alphaproteobacteria bacterium]|nr:DUF1800 domain-containing protein [Alphaproteobacteria bacterium]
MAIETKAFVAVNRFGLGARPGELKRAASDPHGWLEAQLEGRSAQPDAFAALESGPATTRSFFAADDRNAKEVIKLFSERFRDIFMQEVAARTRVMATSAQPYRERLVAFWSNHFTVSAKRPVVAGLAGAFEREAIRPHVTGRFADMLLAVARHPAMLLFLDNVLSIGPNSMAGQRTGKGLNENHAREILELHTLGVKGGYDQRDVVELAKLITGWSLSRREPGATPGTYKFHGFAHEPGTKTLLGVRYDQGGEAEGEAALRALARHPSTAIFIATKFARHFIADDPPAPAVERLARVFRDTDGDLRALAAAVVDEPAAWQAPLAKFKTPQDFLVSVLRATDIFPAEPRAVVGSFEELGQVPFTALSPAGWDDNAAAWAGPEAVLRRAEWSLAFARRAAPARQPIALMEATIAPVASARTREAIAQAPSAQQGLALLLASPEFLRR